MYALVLTAPAATGVGYKVRDEIARSRKLEYLADLAFDSHRTRQAYQRGLVSLMRVAPYGEYGRLSPGEVREIKHRMRTGEWPV